MLLEQFGKKVCSAVEEILGAGYEAVFQEVTKNNGVCFHGIVISVKGSNVSPAIYIDELHQDYEEGRPFGDIVYDILSVYKRHAKEIRIDMDFFMRFEEVKNRILYKLIHAGRNQKLLEEIPYIEWNDLALVFYYSFDDERIGKASILIRNSHLEMWKVDLSVLYESAKTNMLRMRPAQLLPVRQIIQEIMADGCGHAEGAADLSRELSGMAPAQESMMYLLSNHERVFGAAAVLDADSLKKLTERLNKNLIILPSSIHEVLLVPDDGRAHAGREFYRNMVKEVNDTQVEPEERLSYNVYYYDRISGKITIL